VVTVTLYTRQGCHLCEQVLGLIEKARAEAEFHLEIADIDQDPELKAKYDWEVPVVAVNGRDTFNYAMEYQAFVQKLRRG
jgi:glutaredoxin